MKARAQKTRKKQEHRRAQQRNLAGLSVLEQQRAGFAENVEAVVRGAISRFVANAPDGSPIVEIGSGAGQLYRWLPESVRSRVTLTDVSSELVNALTKSLPEAKALRADASALPFATASIAEVLGLCVFDILPQPEQAVSELARVLVPGGSFIHFLDLGTSLEPVFERLVAAGKVPLPNFFDEQAFALGLSPLADLLVVDRAALELVVALLTRAKHPAAASLISYLRPFLPATFNRVSAARFYVQLMSNAQQSREFKQLLLGVHKVIEQPHFLRQIPWHLQAVETFSLFREKLRQAFTSVPDFTITFDELVLSRSYFPISESGLPAACGYHGRFMSIEHYLPESIAMNDGITLEALNGDATKEAPEGRWFIREAAVHVWVATRT